MKLTGLVCGHISCDRGLLFAGELSREMIRIPVTCYLVTHPGGLLLWDTGMNSAVRADPVGHWGGIAKRTTVPDLGPGEDVVARLASCGVLPTDIDLVVNSHLHNDHCGMNTAFPSARVMIRSREFEHAEPLMDVPSSGFIRGDFFGDGQNFELFDYDDEFDVFGDGRVKLISTTGHTPGHQCLQVTFASGRSYVLSGDAVYNHGQICSCRASGISWDADAMVSSMRRLRALEADGAQIVVGHDPDEWGSFDGTHVLHEESR